MQAFSKRLITILVILSIISSFFTINVSAAPIANWGQRGVVATEPSSKVASFYTGNYTYAKLSNLTGGTTQSNAHESELYSTLQTLMKSKHTTIQNYQDTRQYYKYTDCVNGDTSKLVSFYSGTMVNSTWDSGNTYNREHTWPDSKCITSGREAGDSADIMMLRPTIPTENGSRGNKAYGESSGYFNPSDAVKGDCARTMLYMYVRWGNTGKMWGYSGVMENLSILLKWCKNDPVDTWELGRNDAVQSITGTRNTFVDYPELVFLMFSKEIPSDMSTPSGIAKNGSENNDTPDREDPDQNDGNAGSNSGSNTGSSSNSGSNSNSNSSSNTNNTPDREDEERQPDAPKNDNSEETDKSESVNDNSSSGKPFDPNSVKGQYVPIEEEEDYTYIWIIIGVSAGVLVIATVVVTIVLVNKKKKKALPQISEDEGTLNE